MKFLDHYRMGRLKRFSGNYQTDVEILYEGESRICIARWTYHGDSNSFDVHYVGLTESGKDLWHSLDYMQIYLIDRAIQKQIFDWAVSVGIKHPFY